VKKSKEFFLAEIAKDAKLKNGDIPCRGKGQAEECPRSVLGGLGVLARKYYL